VEVGEIDIRGDVLAAGVLIDGEAFEALLEKVAAERALGTAMIEFLCGAAVINGEHAACFPVRHPCGEIVLIGLVDLDELADGMGFEKS